MSNLANKYRPKAWAEVVGQNTVVSVLSKQITSKKIKQAYLFVGSAGSGKTSVARIFAKSLNGDDYDPVEIDAASNNGIDSIREIIQDAQQAPFGYEYKVYVIDEAQQLTKAAWDASLKIIEEPPETAVFIFCTTNPSKIPETIMSRVQRFDFKRVVYSDIALRLAYIINEEFGGSTVCEYGALERIAIASNGCVRQAVQYLDKCVSTGEKITSDLVESVIGFSTFETLLYLVDGICNKKLDRALDAIRLFQDSVEPMQFYDDLTEFAVQYSICIVTGDKSLCDLPSDIKESISYDNKRVVSLMNRLIGLRKVVDARSAYSIVKAVCIEFCG